MKKLLLALLVVIGPAPAFAATENLTQLLTDARVLAFDAKNAARQRFSDAQITEFLNVAQRETMAQTHCLMASMSFSLSPNTSYYALPSNFDAMRRVTIGQLNMQEMSPAALDGRSRGWESATGHPTYYFINFSSRGQVGFAPWPLTSTDTDTIKVEYEIQANDLVNGTDLPYNGVAELQDYYHALSYFAAAQMTAIDGLTTQSTLYLQIYSNMNAVMQKRCMDRPNYLPSAAASP